MGGARTEMPAFLAETSEDRGAKALEVPRAADVERSEGGPAPDLRRDELFTLYKHAIDDRNFQVTLNWDRTKHYFVFNVGVFTVAGALTQVSGAKTAVTAYLVLVALNSAFAAYSIKKGHDYYRQARRRLKAIETRVVGDEFASKTTRGMVRDMTGTRASWTDRITITTLQIVLQVIIALAAAVTLVLWLIR